MVVVTTALMTTMMTMTTMMINDDDEDDDGLEGDAEEEDTDGPSRPKFFFCANAWQRCRHGVKKRKQKMGGDLLEVAS